MTKSRNPNPASRPGTKQSPTLWHRLLGKEMELALAPRGVTVLTEVQIGSNPPKVDIVLLRRKVSAGPMSSCFFCQMAYGKVMQIMF